MPGTKGRFRKLITNHSTRIETSFSDALMNYFAKISKLPQAPPHLPPQRKERMHLTTSRGIWIWQFSAALCITSSSLASPFL
jgi:hypothetical protein